jgi:hypothetical protein
VARGRIEFGESQQRGGGIRHAIDYPVLVGAVT